MLVVGPSGAGKDTLLRLAREELAHHPQIAFPKRLVTRSSSIWEDHDTIGDDDFERGVERGLFTLAWRAHGLGYAIPGACLREAASGNVLVCNVSRTVVDSARMRLPNVSVVEITAPPGVLAARLASRGRSEDSDLKTRLERSQSIAPVEADLTIVNDGAPSAGAGLLTDFLRRKVGVAL